MTTQFTDEHIETPEALDDDLDLDNLDLDADSGEDEETGSETADDTAPGATAKTARSSNRALIRRVANKAAEVAVADPKTITLTASLLAASEGVSDLTVAIMTADRGATQPIDDLNRIAEADPFEAATVATGLGRDRLKAVWALLDTLGSAPSGTVPPAIAKAGLALAKHVLREIDIEAINRDLAAVQTLLKRY